MKTKKWLSIFISVLILFSGGPLGVLRTSLMSSASDKQYQAGDTIAFGWYPQSEVKDASLINKLNALEGDWISYNYYSGTGDQSNYNMVSGDWMKYKDVFWESQKYRAVCFTQYRPYHTGQPFTDSWNTQQRNGYFTNEVYWFIFEPIYWRVLNPNTGMIISENLLDSQAYRDTVFYYSLNYYSSAEKLFYANNYAESSIRKWLNTDFYNTAFSHLQQEIMVYTENENMAYNDSLETVPSYKCENTNDKIYLLSTIEVFDSSLGFSSNSSRQGIGTDYARCNGLSGNNGLSDWWLRSAGISSGYASRVSGSGGYTRDDVDVCMTSLGVRPVLNIRSLSEIIQCPVTEVGTDDIPPTSITKEITYSYHKDQKDPSMDKTTTIEVTLNSDCFNFTSQIYQHSISQFCSQFVTIGYARESQVIDALEALGFTNIDIDLDVGRDGVNYFIASKSILANNQEKVLIFCGFIGSHKLQWNSNFDPYGTERSKISDPNLFGTSERGTIHLGFEDAKEYVMKKIENYYKKNITEQGIDSSLVKFLVTGHSRGAATANLVAADLIRGGLGKSGYTHYCSADDVYTYTFATPNNVKKAAIKDFNESNFDRIFNIVNPQDFVTWVLPTAWGFSKYGTTYLLPTRNNVGKQLYTEFNEKMRSYFSLVQPGIEFDDYNKGEVTVYKVVNKFANNVGGLDDFYQKELYAYSERRSFGGGILATYEEYYYFTAFEYFQKVLCPFVNKMNQEIGAALLAAKILKSDATQTGVLARLTGFFLANGTNLHQNFGHAHMAETYCSYIMTMESDWITTNKSSKYYTAHCPVDIEIYDKGTGEMLGRTVRGVVDEEITNNDNSVFIEVEGDEKSFILPNMFDYEIKYIAYDTGIMDLTVATIDNDLIETERINFFEVPLEQDLLYDSTSESGMDLFDYVLNAEDNTQIEPNQSFDEDNAEQYTVTVIDGSDLTVNISTINVVSGDYITITPHPLSCEIFRGWFVNGIIVSEEQEYRFRPASDITISAVFTSNHDDEDGDGYCDICGTCTRNCICGKYHSGPLSRIIIFFHKIAYYFRNLFMMN